MAATAPSTAASPTRRLEAMDWMRGLVMVLMTIDHASDAFNGHRVFSDSALRYHGEALPMAGFLTRWITHLCAPTFVFLAGAALSLSVERRKARGERAWSIDKHILSRGLFLLLLDPLWMSLGFMNYRMFLFQVMYALGFSLMCMSLLRRLPSWALAVLGVALLVGVDVVVSARLDPLVAGASHLGPNTPPIPPPPLVIGLLISGGLYFGKLIVAYPLFPWLGIMMIGWACGSLFRNQRHAFHRGLLFCTAGISMLALFYVLRRHDGFGNMALHRMDDSALQYLHVSKYPPSITYALLELGIMSVLLGGFELASSLGGDLLRRALRPLGVLGSNALFYYILHVHLLMLASYALGVHLQLGLGATYLSTAIAVFVLYFACGRYAQYKATHDNVVTRFV